MKKRVKITPEELKISDYIVDFVGVGWLDTTFLKHKFVIKDKEHLDKVLKKLKNNGIKELIVEREVLEDKKIETQIPEVAEEDFIDKKSLKSVSTLYKEAIVVTKSLLNDVRAGKLINVSEIKSITKEITAQAIIRGNLLSSVTKLKDYDDYTFQHSLNVSIFAASLAAKLNKDKKFIENITLSALLHDVGKMFIPNEILNKPGKLTDEEFELMKKHVTYGYEYLLKVGMKESDIKICLEHHERADGSGYPNGLKDEEISIEGKIGAVVDIYDALTSQRIYKPKISPATALKMMMGWVDKHLNRKIFEFFVANTGIYPVGTLVLLNTNEIGIVAKVNYSKLTQPLVIIFKNSKGQDIPPLSVDLGKQKTILRKIIGPLDPNKISVPKQIYTLIEENLEQ